MRKILLLLVSISCFIVSGCGVMIIVPVDPTPLSEENATLIIYQNQGYRDPFDVFIGRTKVGEVTSEKPIKMSINPGQHDLYVNIPSSPFIRRITSQNFEKGKVYFMRIWLEIGVWVSSMRISPTHEINSYEVKSYRQ